MNRKPRLIARRDVVILDFSDRRERDFDDRTVGTEHFDARGSKRLSGFHTPNRPSDSPPISRDDLYVIFTVQGLKCRECFSYFHFAGSSRPMMRAPRVPMQLRATANDYLAYTKPAYYSSLT